MGRHQPKALANTWFIFASDHGDMVGDHHLWRKTYAYEGSARIPFIVVPPKGQAPARPVADEVTELRDLMPTMLDIAQAPCPGTVDGASVVPLMSGTSTKVKWRDYIHGEHSTCYSHEQEMQYVTDGRQKFIWLPRIDRRYWPAQQNLRRLYELHTFGHCIDCIALGDESPALMQLLRLRDRQRV